MAGRAAKILRLAPVRLILGLAILIGGAILAQLALSALPPGLPLAVRRVIGTAVTIGVVAALYVAFVRLLEQRRPTELMGPGAVGELAIGLVFGAGLFAVSFGLIALFGGFQLFGLDPNGSVGPALAVALSSGVVEEILIRGVVFRILEEWLGTWLALAISAAFFGFGHAFNANATVASSVAIALEAGVLLAAAFMVTRRLWLAIGLHIAWNFTQAGIFGVPVSGNELHGLLRSAPTGPDWLSGGAFGAEASGVSVVVCLSAAVALLARTRRQRGFMPPSWRRRVAQLQVAGAAR